MTGMQRYILSEVKVIERECHEKGISASEWVKRYAVEYCRSYSNGSVQKAARLKRRWVDGNCIGTS